MLSDAAPRALDDGSLVDGVRRSNLDTGHKRYDTRSLQVLVYQFLTVYGRQYVYRTYPCLPTCAFSDPEWSLLEGLCIAELSLTLAIELVSFLHFATYVNMSVS